MTKVYIATKDDVTAALAAFAASLGASSASADDGTPVGRVVLDSVLRPGYVKANGATLANATVDYPRLVTFVREHPELLADDTEAQTANLGLYVYVEEEDTLTLPNYMNRVLQCGESVSSVKAGLPNITGTVWGSFCTTGDKNNFTAVGGKLNEQNKTGTLTHGAFSTSVTTIGYNKTISLGSYSNGVVLEGPNFNASSSNAIYGSSSTVQPPAITLIPQIRY